MPTPFAIILCTCPDKDSAKKLAELLVSKNLAACVNIVPGITSVYSWEDKIETAHEQLLLIKTLYTHYQAIETLLRKQHPYEIPEIIALPIERGLPEYLEWMTSCLSPN